MKRLVLLRHANSSWSDPKLDDHDRPLSRRGIREAACMAEFMESSQAKFDYVLCSSSVRTRQTLAHLERHLSLPAETHVLKELYLPTSEGIRKHLERVPDSAECVLIVGHSPSLEALALELGNAPETELRARFLTGFPSGAMCVLELPIRSFSELGRVRGTIRALISPRDLRDPSIPVPEPTRADALDLAKRARVLSAAQEAVGNALAQLRANLEGAMAGEDPEFVHQMRVAVRRLRVALGLFRRVLDQIAVERLEEELSWVFGALGRAREWDVFQSEFLEPLKQRRGARALIEVVRVQREQRSEELRNLLGSPRFTRLVRDLLSFHADLVSQREHSPGLRRFARKKLTQRREKLLGLVDVLKTRKPTALHEFRKELKKLRYSAEFVRGAFPKGHMRKYLKRLGAVQDALGQLNDVAAGERLLKASLAKLPPGRERDAMRANVRMALDAKSVEAGMKLQPALDALAAEEPFWM